jgi:hypothetical protein
MIVEERLREDEILFLFKKLLFGLFSTAYNMA